MPDFSTQATILRTIDYGDSDKIVTLFTSRYGKIVAIAKGAKRAKSAFGGPIEVLTYGSLMFTTPDSPGLATLTEFDVDPNRTNPALICVDLYVLHCGLLAVELLDNLAKAQLSINRERGQRH